MSVGLGFVELLYNTPFRTYRTRTPGLHNSRICAVSMHLEPFASLQISKIVRPENLRGNASCKEP